MELRNLPKMALLKLIGFYQATLSPDHGPFRHIYSYGYCRHEPTCSEYAKQMIAQRGAVAGSLLATKRVLTCTPWRRVSDKKILKTLERI